MSREETVTHEGRAPSDRLQILLFGEGWSRVHDIDPRTTPIVVIGRDATCTIVIDDKSVSRRHAELSLATGALTIRDLESANGITVDDVPLARERAEALRPGARVGLGAVTLVAYGGTLASTTGETEALGDTDDTDDPMHEVHELCDRVAASDLSVLLLGETGTGKELLAERIHAKSNRAHGPFVRLNAAAVPETLAESQLFGHERGAFTGATGPKDGVIVAADGGTLLLDEFGDLPAGVQSKLLRVVESGHMMRVGATTEISANVRWVSATSRDVESMVANGELRSDLVFRLAGVTIHVPALRDRRSAIVPIARRLLASASQGRARLTAEAERQLVAHDWPGNVRELKATMQRAAVLGNYGAIEARHLFVGAFRFGGGARASSPPPAVTERPPATPLRDDIDSVERERILAALATCGGNQTRAAEMLGIARRTLTSKLDRLDVTRPRKRP